MTGAKIRVEAERVDVRTSETHRILGTSYLELRDREQARKHLERAMELSATMATDALALERAKSLNALGLLSSSERNTKEAIAYFEQSLAIFRKTLPERHPMIANCLWNLGRELTASDAERGQGLVEEALAIRREVLPADHPDIALLLEYLGSMLVQRGELWRAESHYVEALEIRKVQTSVSDNDLVADYYSLAYIRLLRGKNADDELEQLEALLLEATDEQFRQRISKAIQKLRAMSAQAGAGSEP